MCNILTLESYISFRWGSKLLTLISMKCKSKSAVLCNMLHSIRRIMFWWCHILWIVFHTKNLNFPHMTRQPLINKSWRKIMHFSSIFTFWTAHGNWFSQMQDSINCSIPFPCYDVTDLTVLVHFSNPVYWLSLCWYMLTLLGSIGQSVRLITGPGWVFLDLEIEKKILS